jgi:hypothetical protein
MDLKVKIMHFDHLDTLRQAQCPSSVSKAQCENNEPFDKLRVNNEYRIKSCE